MIEKSASGTAMHKVQRSWSPYSLAPAGARARLRRIWQWTGFDHDLASKLRYEAEMLLLRGRCAISPQYRAQVRKMDSQRELRVHLGCGNALLPGWINLDCYPPPRTKGIDILTTDMRRELPIASGSVMAVFSEHFLEHLSIETVRSTLLPEVFRILAPSGRVRIGVPDGEYFIDQYVSYRAGSRDPLFDQQSAGKTPMTMLNEIAHGFGHRFVYDFSTLSKLLTETGFVNVRRCRPFETAFNEFQGKDRVDPWRNAMTLYVEAEAPAD
ncbi:MAG TPA: methyltransferase domain-containing protein [Steroidobacteraceae bacterium]